MVNKKLLVITLLTIFITLSLIPFTLAEQDKEVKVGLYLLNLGKYEIATGSFTADFYLSLKCLYLQSYL